MQYRNVPYKFQKWKSFDGTECSAFTCKYFNFSPYHIMSFSTELEQDMRAQIDEYIDNREVYKIKRDLSNQAAADFYKLLKYKGD